MITVRAPLRDRTTRHLDLHISSGIFCVSGVVGVLYGFCRRFFCKVVGGLKDSVGLRA